MSRATCNVEKVADKVCGGVRGGQRVERGEVLDAGSVL
jgi:hypothetical protein